MRRFSARVKTFVVRHSLGPLQRVVLDVQKPRRAAL